MSDEDILTPLRFSRILAERIPGAELLVIPGGSHAYNIELPDEFNRLTLAWLKAHRSSAGQEA